MKTLQRVVSGAVLLSFISTQAGAVTLQRLPTFYASTDALGSTTLVTQDNGTVVEKRSYDPFGKRRNPNWSAVDVYGQIAGAQLDQGYTSHVEDFETDTVHMRGRTYDPKLARFTSADPFVDGANATQRWNRYAYVSNNPLRFTDPSGFRIVATPPPIPAQNETISSPAPQVVTVHQAPGENKGKKDKDGEPEVSDQDPDQGSNMPPSNEAHGGGQSNGASSSGDRDGGNYNGKGESPRAERERERHEVAERQQKMQADAREQRRRQEQLDQRGGRSANGNSFGMAPAPPLEGAIAGGGTTTVTVGANAVLAAGGLAVAVTALAGIAAAGLIYMSGNDNDRTLDELGKKAEELVEKMAGEMEKAATLKGKERRNAEKRIDWFSRALDEVMNKIQDIPKDVPLDQLDDATKGGGGASNDNGSGSE